MFQVFISSSIRKHFLWYDFFDSENRYAQYLDNEYRQCYEGSSVSTKGLSEGYEGSSVSTKGLSEGYEGSSVSTKGSSSFSAWYHRIAPLIRNKQVRVLSIINCILTTVNLFIVLLIVTSCFWLLGLKIKHNQLLQHDMPCFYGFKPWSQCSATCWADGQPMPIMKREIDENKLVMTRGESYAKCPSNVNKNLIQKAPCNLQRCPLKLSSFTNWTHCIHKNTELRKAGGCYQIRILPLEDRLIYVDTPELTRNCSDDQCPEYIP